MDDWVKSSAGGEATDKSFAAQVIKPLWLFQPLPLSQVDPESSSLGHEPPGYLPTLQSACLSSISANFHLFTPSSFSTLPTQLVRKILYRAATDRGYEYTPTPQQADDSNPTVLDGEYDGPSHSLRPDAATLWAYSATVDPELHLPNPEFINMSSDHILPVRMDNTLHCLAPQQREGSVHPLVEIPKAFEEYHRTRLHAPGLSLPPLQLLTTLHIDGMQGTIDDTNLQNLKWCTHLTVLWTKKCEISDYGVRLLASSLQLPGPCNAPERGVDPGRGPRRLRAWFMSGCKKITDASLRTFARWPGLVLLDLRDTSCTSASGQIFDSQHRSLFPSHARGFQPCTSGLKALFSARSTPAKILDSLCWTLIKPGPTPNNGSSSQEGDPQRWWLGLHVVSSTQPLRAEWLPDPSAVDETPRSRYTDYTQNKAYRGDGIGRIFGGDVFRLEDKARDYRYRLNTALRMQAEAEGLTERTPGYWETLNKGKKKESKWAKWEDKKKPEKLLKGYKMPNRGARWGERDQDEIASGRIPTGSAAAGADERSRAFVMGGQGKQEGPEEIKGDKALMLVRMVDDNWEDLQWATKAISTVSMAGPSKVATVRKRIDVDLIDPLALGSQLSQGPRPSQLPRGPFTPFQAMRTATPSQDLGAWSEVDVKPSSQSLRPANPFRQTGRLTSGLRPLIPSAAGRATIKDEPISPFMSSSSDSMSDPLDTVFSSPVDVKHELPPTPSSAKFEDELSFSSAPVKRRFGGGDSGAEKKRRRMKMFSGRA